MENFWESLPKPFLALAPMEDVTDTVFRQIIAGIGKPDVMFTEFVNVEGIVNSPLTPLFIKERGTEGVSFVTNGITQRLMFSDTEQPLVAQLWGTRPESFFQAAKIVASLGFAGIDINLGCPKRAVLKTGGCAALIGQNSQVAEIIAATRSGSKLPTSVKTRLGVDSIQTESWIGFLLSQNLAAITVHGRTARETSAVPAHWEEIGKAVKLRGKRKTLIIGNGDVDSLATAQLQIANYGVDGVMVGRGVFNNPWLFAGREGAKQQRLELLKRHAALWGKTYGTAKNPAVLKKFVKMYVGGFPGAAKLRADLMASPIDAL